MAGRSNTTLKKRQKEMARVEKQRDKVAKRMQRKDDDSPAEPEVLTLEQAELLRSQGNLEVPEEGLGSEALEFLPKTEE